MLLKGGKDMLSFSETPDLENRTTPDPKNQEKPPSAPKRLLLFLFCFAIFAVAFCIIKTEGGTDVTDTTAFTQSTTKSAMDIYVENLSKEAPYVGMGESFIDLTVLGSHSGKIKESRERINKKNVTVKTYSFEKDGNIVFTADCANGKVIRVCDNRKSPVPYVGMLESGIGKTTLGEPESKIRHNKECINGKQYTANLYDFKRDGKVIFTARCVLGKVIQVWDDRDRYSTTAASTTAAPKKEDKTTEKSSTKGYDADIVSPYKKHPDKTTTTKPPSTTKKKEDPYDVDDYCHAEDFYYDHYDDFFDYYDAEDYFNEHHS